MSTIRVEKSRNYTVVSNYHFKEKNMSLKAKGLLSLMLSLPDDWDYSISGLVAICKENETSIKTALDELKEFGYLKVVKKLPNETESGRIEYEYIVYEKKQEGEKQGLENLGVEFLGVENQGQLNTNKSITNKQNNLIKEKKENNKKKEIEILNEYDFSDKCKNAIIDWLNYKKEKRQSYTPIGLKGLINKFNKWKNQFGEDYVLEAIDNSISNNYSGVFAQTRNKTQPTKPVKSEDTELATIMYVDKYGIIRIEDYPRKKGQTEWTEKDKERILKEKGGQKWLD